MSGKDAAAGRRKLAAIMFADMVSFSALAQRDEALALELVAEQRRLLAPLLERFGGRLIKTMGDGYMAEFASALEAAECAVELQRALAARNAGVEERRRMRMRVGVHLGDVVEREGDVFGDGVNIAARIEPKAEPGGICVSQQVFDQIHNKIKRALVPLGEVELKNIERPLAIYRLESGESAAPAPKTEPPRKDKNSVAVLPFANMSPEREDEFLSDGITEEIITALSAIEGLRVSARTSSFAFKGKNEDVRRVAERLNAAWVVEGSVRRAGARLRVSAQLVNAADGYPLWSERFDREMRDVFAIQDEIAAAVAAALKLKLGRKAAAPAARPLTTTEAYELYLKGRFHWNQRGAGLRKARHYFELAVLEDPGYAPAYAGLADAFSLMAFYGAMRPHTAAPRIRAAAGRALELDATLPEAHAPLGFISLMYDRDAGAALRSLGRALELNANYSPAHYWSAVVHGALEEHDKAWDASRRAMELDPLSPIVVTISGWLRIFARRFEESAGLLRQAIALNPNFMLPHWVLGQALIGLGDKPAAIAAFEKAVALSGDSPWAVGMLGWAYALDGRTDAARKILAELERRAAAEYVPGLMPTRVCLGLGDAAGARRHLARAVDERDSLLVWLKPDFAYDALRADPACRPLLDEIAVRR